MGLSKSLRKLYLQAGRKTSLTCGKSCGIKTLFGMAFGQDRAVGFGRIEFAAFKAMSSNQLCNSHGINISANELLLIFL